MRRHHPADGHSPGAFSSYTAYQAEPVQNNVLTSQNRQGRTTTMTYDGAGNLETVTGPVPVSPLTTFHYDPAGTGLLFSIEDARGKTTTYGYDAEGNRTSITTPLGFETTMTYDAAGRQLTLVDPRGNVAGGDPAQYQTTFTYDGAGNILTAIDPLDHTTTTVFDPAGNRTSVTDANDHTTTYGYDAANYLTSVTDPRNKTTTYAYDAVGNLITRTDAKNHVTTFAYNLAHRLTTETRPLSRVWSYTYDANRNRTKVVDAIGNSTSSPTDGTTTFAYDNYNRLTSTNYSDATPDVTYTYDLTDNRLSMVDSATTTYQYDTLDRLTLVDRGSGQTIGYTYDAVGNLLTRSPGGGTSTTYTYDDDSRLATMMAAGQMTSYGYDPAGGLITTTLPAANGYIEARTYDTARRLTDVKNTKGVATLSKATYTLDPVGNPLTIVTTTTTKTYTYDPADRLTQVCYTVTCTGVDNFRTYTYDDVGNRLTEVQGSGTTTYIYDVADQLTKTTGLGGTVKYTYDLNGSETGAGSRTFTYDLARRVKTTKLGGTTTTYTYDGDGLRLSASTGSGASATTRFFWDPNGPLALLAREADGSGAVLREYQYGHDLASMLVGGSPFYFHRDGLGDVLNLTSTNGTTEWTYDYHPFGTARTTTKNDPVAPANFMQFTGQYLDPTGLYHLRARQYDPATGRFLTTDPVGPATDDPYVATYIYVRNNPIVNTDPSGRCLGPALIICVGAGVGVLAYVLGTAAANAIQDRDWNDGLNPVDAVISGGAGAISGGIGGLAVGLGSKVLLNAILGMAAVDASQQLGGRSDPVEMIVGGVLGGVGAAVIPKLGGSGLIGIFRGLAGESGINAALTALQNLVVGGLHRGGAGAI